MEEDIDIKKSFIVKFFLLILVFLLMAGIIFSISSIVHLFFSNLNRDVIGIIGIVVSIVLGRKIYEYIIMNVVIIRAIGWTIFFWLLAILLTVIGAME